MEEKRPLNVWVLYGGHSSERDVSIRSGKGVMAALERRNFNVSGFDVNPANLSELPWLEKKPDIVFLGLHGSFGEDGAIQGFLEANQVPYVGSGVLSSALCFHKGFAKQVLRSAGIPVPHSYDFSGEEHFLNEDRAGRLPSDFFQRRWFIKPAQEGSTIGIERFDPALLEKGEDLREVFLKKFAHSHKFCSDVLVEEWVDGVECSTPIVGGRATPTVEIRPKSEFYDYESKYTSGMTEYICPATVGEADLDLMSQMALQSFYELKCADYARIDFIVGKQGPVVLEMNTLPGMTETSLLPKSLEAEGIEYDELVASLVLSSYQRQNRS